MVDDPLNKLKVKRGIDLPQSKLNESLVIEARNLHEESRKAIKKLQESYSARGLARRYGVHVRTMEKALSGETWSHIL